MAENSKIEWCHHTFNPWWGCAKVSPACDNCYAERDAGRYHPSQVLWGVDAERRTFGDKHWNEPLKWEAKAVKLGVRYRVFCASMADVFDKNSPPGARERLFRLISATPHLDWLLLTKRIGNVPKMLPPDWLLDGRPPGNVWLGISVVNQEEAERDIPKLLAIPARVRWISAEPLVGPINLIRFLGTTLCAHEGGEFYERAGLDWVVTGGESGNKARPADPAWFTDLRDQCKQVGVPFLFKQWGEWAPWDFDSWEHTDAISEFTYERAWTEPTVVYRVGKKKAGRLLDGVQHDGYPMEHRNG